MGYILCSSALSKYRFLFYLKFILDALQTPSQDFYVIYDRGIELGVRIQSAQIIMSWTDFSAKQS